ncbi:Mitogen-activated protein kinase-like protein MMK1 [Hibiscus syriacus]|uniref:mitogen-activated protein kinase n=1 Tax=Hibiscus syriacus TaxID=106335 RepID=A0A6A3C4N6_HIBSY|nr:Mitogen-activated protein kinase-like protein MMK1 [Hibiscus syriacus]
MPYCIEIPTTSTYGGSSAFNSEANETVAVKKIPNAFSNGLDARRTLREIKLLCHLGHENVVAIRDIILPPQWECFNDVYIVYELMETDLRHMLRSNDKFTEEHYQTEYVAAEWYSSPELLFFSSHSTAAIDIWSVGCIVMELMIRKPLFPGRDRLRQLRLLLETYIRKLPTYPHQSFAEKFPKVHSLAIDLVEKMLRFDPRQRITVADALAHPYLTNLHDISDEPVCMVPINFDFDMCALAMKQMKELIYQEAVAFYPELH